MMVANRPKVSFWQDDSTSPRNCSCLFANYIILIAMLKELQQQMANGVRKIIKNKLGKYVQ
jgi:hypothetical protein